MDILTGNLAGENLPLQHLFGNQGGVYKPAKQGWHKQGGIWRLFYTTEIPANAAPGSSVNASTLFGANWAADTLKRLIVPQGVITGIITLGPGMGGELVLEVRGEVLGLNGSPGGGDGGHAIVAHQSFTLEVTPTGIVRSGGGGGGSAGVGGAGQTPYNYSEGPFFTLTQPVYYWYVNNDGTQRATAGWAGATAFQNQGNGNTTSVSAGGWTYTRGAYFESGSNGVYYRLSRNQTRYNPTSGGVSPNPGRGSGYNGARTLGGAVVAGGTDAGASGKPGDGGDWAADGTAGTAGTNGSAGAGTAGGPGGPAGKAVHMIAGACTLNFNDGLIQGLIS